MAFSFQDTDRATFECLLSEEQQLKRICGWDSNSARTSIKWQRLCEKMYNLCVRRIPMADFYVTDFSSSDPIQKYQKMFEKLKDMFQICYPDVAVEGDRTWHFDPSDGLEVFTESSDGKGVELIGWSTTHNGQSMFFGTDGTVRTEVIPDWQPEVKRANKKKKEQKEKKPKK